MPEPETLAAYYDSDYYGHGAGKFVSTVERVVRFFRYLRARAVGRLIPKGRVLDVGCGRGIMLKYLKDWGFQVDGIELDTVAAVRAQNNLNQRIFHRLEELAQHQERQYEAICFWHSLEHHPRPGEALMIADRLLAPGGLLVVSAPHMESLQSRLSGSFWLHLDLPRHLVHFDMNGLAQFLKGKGYQLIGHHHFSQEYNVIDTLCYLYAILGFDHLYPFHLIQGIQRHENCCDRYGDSRLNAVLGLPFFLPLTGLAFFVANFFSLLKGGSTTTIFSRKPMTSTISGLR
jgi:SAM-dependent methyltransferase